MGADEPATVTDEHQRLLLLGGCVGAHIPAWLGSVRECGTKAANKRPVARSNAIDSSPS
jgi:hypothetical protein